MSKRQRVDIDKLDDACSDCCQFIAGLKVDCEDCPVKKLKVRLKKANPPTKKVRRSDENNSLLS